MLFIFIYFFVEQAKTELDILLKRITQNKVDPLEPEKDP